MADLCTVEDVKFFGGISGSIMDTRIAQMISYMTNEIRTNYARDPTIESTDHNGKMACVYGVLTWLESEGRVRSPALKRRVVNQSDMHVSTEYKEPSRTLVANRDKFNKSFGENFEDHLARISDLPIAGTYDDLVSTYSL